MRPLLPPDCAGIPSLADGLPTLLERFHVTGNRCCPLYFCKAGVIACK